MTALGPPPERRQHGRVSRDTQQLADAYDSIGRPWRTETLLGQFERTGFIDPPERLAGEEFGRLFHLAALHPLRAADMGQRSNSADTPHGSERARRKIAAALDALGGADSICGKAAWHILGCELTIREFALRQSWSGRPMRREVVKGTLIGALGVLAKHWGM